MMTIFYMKSNGKIKVCLTGEHYFSIFGEEEEDYELIYNRIVFPQDDFVIRNLLDYRVLSGVLVLTK